MLKQKLEQKKKQFLKTEIGYRKYIVQLRPYIVEVERMNTELDELKKIEDIISIDNILRKVSEFMR